MADLPPPASAGKPRATGRSRDVVIAVDRLILGLSRHWLLFVNVVVFVYVGLPFLAPVFMQVGAPGPARVIYGMYSSLCHQLGYRSWYLFGERVVYPRDVFESYTSIDPFLTDPVAANQALFAARNFVGNERMGWKVAYCERDVAIYAAIGLFGVIFALPGLQGRVKPLHWVAYALIGIAPIALDGFSQLFSQYPYNALSFNGFAPFAWLPYRESSPALRTLTGALFGLANGWLAFPYLAQSFTEIRRDLETKFQRAGITH